MALAAAVASEYAVITHTERVVSAATPQTKGLARRQVGAVRQVSARSFSRSCAAHTHNAPTYWDRRADGAPRDAQLGRAEHQVRVHERVQPRRRRLISILYTRESRAPARRRADERDDSATLRRRGWSGTRARGP